MERVRGQNRLLSRRIGRYRPQMEAISGGHLGNAGLDRQAGGRHLVLELAGAIRLQRLSVSLIRLPVHGQHIAARHGTGRNDGGCLLGELFVMRRSKVLLERGLVVVGLVKENVIG